MRYAVIGVGALGGFYGGLLARAGSDVHFLARSDYSALRDVGLSVESTLGKFSLPSIQVYQNTDEMPQCDVVIVCTKTTENDRLVDTLHPLIHARSIVLVLQNGLRVEQPFSELVGDGRVLGGCCFLCSNKVAPGHIRHLDYGRITMGCYRGPEEKGKGVDVSIRETILSDFRNAGIEVEFSENLSVARWKKLMWNIPYNGLSVVLNASTKELMESESGRALCEELMREVRDVAIRCGHSIDERHVEKLLADTADMVPYDSSMRVDFLHRRPMEISAIFETPLREAIRVGLEAPKLRVITYQLRFLNRFATGSFA